MSDVFILGAGFSKAISVEMPTTNGVSPFRAPMPDGWGGASISAPGMDPGWYPGKSLSEEILTASFTPPIPDPIRKMIGEDLEKALAFLAQDQPWMTKSQNERHKAIFLSLTNVIRTVIWERSKSPSVPGKNRPHAWLDWLIGYWHENRCAVITLNYDTLVERTASAIYGPKRPAITTGSLYPICLTPAVLPRKELMPVERIPGAEPKESFKLFKLHGSINWFYSGRSDFFGEELFYVPHEGGLDRPFGIAAGTDSDNEDLERLSGKFSLIIPPTLDKSGYFQHEALRAMWFQAGEALRQATRVICMGYSLPDSDFTMAQFLKTCAPQNRVQFEIVDLATRDNRESKVDHFARVTGKDSYEFRQSYSGETCIPEFIRDELIRDREDKGRVGRDVNLASLGESEKGER